MDDWGNGLPEQPAAGERVFGTPSADPQAEPTIIEGAYVAPPLPVAAMPRSRRSVWAVALGLVLTIAIATGVGAFFLVSAGATIKSETSAYVPSGAVFFFAGRLDLPGNQRDKVASFLTHFPGGKDASSFNQKYDKALDDLISAMTNRQSKWTTDFKPWVGDEISFALTSFDGFRSYGSLGMYGMLEPGMTMNGSSDPGAVAIVAVKDQAKAEAWIATQSATTTYSKTTYSGRTINVSSSGTGAYAFADNVLILGSEVSVKAALDAKTKGSIEKNARYQDAIKALKGDRIAWFYVDEKAYMKAMLAGNAITACGPSQSLEQTLAAYDWVSGQVRADDSDLTVEMAMPQPKAANGFNVSNRTSQLAKSIPNSAWMALEIHSVSQYIGAIEKAYSDPKLPAECQASTASYTQMLTQLGGYDWMGDGAMFVSGTGTQVRGALLIAATDVKKADQAVTYWENSLGLTGYHGQTTRGNVTINTYGRDPSSQIEIARTGSIVVVGMGQGSVASVLDTTEATSLSSLDRYKTAMTAANANNIVSMYFDVPGYLKVMTTQMSPSSMSSYNCEVKPYVNQLGGVAMSAFKDGDTQFVRFVITAQGTAASPAPCK